MWFKLAIIIDLDENKNENENYIIHLNYRSKIDENVIICDLKGVS
jgi:hypothetical protein